MTLNSKRDFERVKNNTALTLVYNDELNELEGLCCDLSQSGLGIQTDKPLSIGTECNVKIHDGRSNHSKYQARIEIVRVSTQEEEGEELFILGASILQQF